MAANKKNKKQAPLKPPRRLTLWIVMVLIIFGELFIYTWSRVQYINTGYAIARAEKERQRLKEYHTRLSIEESRLVSTERISRLAGEKSGLRIPDKDQIIVMDR